MNEDDYERLVGENIRARRERLGISRRKFALVCGVSRGYMDRIEVGTANVTVRMLVRIARALGCEPADLLVDAR